MLIYKIKYIIVSVSKKKTQPHAYTHTREKTTTIWTTFDVPNPLITKGFYHLQYYIGLDRGT